MKAKVIPVLSIILTSLFWIVELICRITGESQWTEPIDEVSFVNYADSWIAFPSPLLSYSQKAQVYLLTTCCFSCIDIPEGLHLGEILKLLVRRKKPFPNSKAFDNISYHRDRDQDPTCLFLDRLPKRRAIVAGMLVFCEFHGIVLSMEVTWDSSQEGKCKNHSKMLLSAWRLAKWAKLSNQILECILSWEPNNLHFYREISKINLYYCMPVFVLLILCYVS